VSEAVPPVLFKRLEPQHAVDMVSRGSLRVGTLFEFRAIEGDKERRDEGEGTLQLHSDSGDRVYNSTEELPPVLRGMSIHCGPGGISTKSERAVSITSAGPNMLVYCMSEELIEGDALREWGGACVRIVRPAAFLRAIDKALREVCNRQGRQLGPVQRGRCSYVDRTHNWHQSLPPTWLLKPLSFSPQKEVRAAWVADDVRDLKAVIVESPEIADSCQMATGNNDRAT